MCSRVPWTSLSCFSSLMSPATSSSIASPEASSDSCTCVLTAFYAFKSHTPADCHFSRTEMWAPGMARQTLLLFRSHALKNQSSELAVSFFLLFFLSYVCLELLAFPLFHFVTAEKLLTGTSERREGRERDSFSQHGGFCQKWLGLILRFSLRRFGWLFLSLSTLAYSITTCFMPE